MSESSKSGTVLPESRLVAALGHCPEVRVAERSSTGRVHLKLTNNGIGNRELKKIRSFGYEIVAVSPRFNRVSLKRKNREDGSQTTGRQ